MSQSQDINRRIKEFAERLKREQDNTKALPKKHGFPERPERVHKWSERDKPKNNMDARQQLSPDQNENKAVFEANLLLHEVQDQVARLQGFLAMNPAFVPALEPVLEHFEMKMEYLDELINKDENQLSHQERGFFLSERRRFMSDLQAKGPEYF